MLCHLSFLGEVLVTKVFPVVLEVFGDRGFIIKTKNGIVWSEGLLLDTSVVGSYTKRWQSE